MKKYVLFGAVCAGLCFGGIKYFSKRQPNRYFQWYKILHQWILIRQDETQVVDYFRDNEYKRVAIYGMGELGKLFLRELSNTEIEIPYVIDQNAGSITVSNIETLTLREVKEDVDVIVVTVVDKFDVVKADIEKYVNVPVISLEDILFSL